MKTRGSDIAINLELSFMEAVEGCSRTVQYHRTDICGTCNGSKAKPGTKPTTCGGCQGQGFQTIR
jgi:molecular chaperone DnaJ